MIQDGDGRIKKGVERGDVERIRGAVAGGAQSEGNAAGNGWAGILEAVLYLGHTGCPWRDLPARFGTWSAVYMRFRRWEKAGVWRGLWEQLEQGACPALLQVFIDSTSIPVHPHAAGAPKKTAGQRLWAAREAA